MHSIHDCLQLFSLNAPTHSMEGYFESRQWQSSWWQIHQIIWDNDHLHIIMRLIGLLSIALPLSIFVLHFSILQGLFQTDRLICPLHSELITTGCLSHSLISFKCSQILSSFVCKKPRFHDGRWPRCHWELHMVVVRFSMAYTYPDI